MDTNTPPVNDPASSERILHGQDDVENLRLKNLPEARTCEEFRTPVACSLARKDFNFLSRKMFIRSLKDHDFMRQCYRLIDEFAAEVTMLGYAVEHLDRWPEAQLWIMRVDLRITGPMSSRMLIQLRRLDRAASILYRAQLFGSAVTSQERLDYLRPAISAFRAINKLCGGLQDPRKIADAVSRLSLAE